MQIIEECNVNYKCYNIDFLSFSCVLLKSTLPSIFLIKILIYVSFSSFNSLSFHLFLVCLDFLFFQITIFYPSLFLIFFSFFIYFILLFSNLNLFHFSTFMTYLTSFFNLSCFNPIDN
jgi:hypothetical protein